MVPPLPVPPLPAVSCRPLTRTTHRYLVDDDAIGLVPKASHPLLVKMQGNTLGSLMAKMKGLSSWTLPRRPCQDTMASVVAALGAALPLGTAGPRRYQTHLVCLTLEAPLRCPLWLMAVQGTTLAATQAAGVLAAVVGLAVGQAAATAALAAAAACTPLLLLSWTTLR